MLSELPLTSISSSSICGHAVTTRQNIFRGIPYGEMGGRKRRTAMKKVKFSWKQYVWLSVLMTGLGMLLWGIGATLSHTMRWEIRTNLVCEGIAAVVIGGFCAFLMQPMNDHWDFVNSLPRLHRWDHNGMIMIAAGMDYQLAVAEEERDALANGKPQRLPRPTRHIIFHKEPFRQYMYGLDALNKLTEDCSVVRSEMDVPARPVPGQSLSFQQMWRLIHGPKSICPDIPDSWTFVPKQ